MYFHVHFLPARFAKCKSRCCMEPPPSVAILIRRGLFFAVRRSRCAVYLQRAPFEIDDVDTRRTAKKYRRHAKECISCTFFSCEFALRTRFGLEPAASVPLLIRRGLFAAAAWMPLVSTRSDVSRLRETRSQNYTRMYSFDGRCAVYFKRTGGGGYNGPHNQTYRSVRVF